MIVSPIFYMGNKKKLIKKGLIELFPQDIDAFIDLFAGSSVVALNVNANRYIVNDLDGVLDEFDRIIGLDRLKAIHLNDSKNPFESHKDRHEKIGEGSIGNEAISRIINNPRIKDLPFFLETPNDLEGYAKEIKLLKSLRAE